MTDHDLEVGSASPATPDVPTRDRASDLRTPARWLNDGEFAGIEILDYDGWRGADWRTPITVQEFRRRLWQCTITGPVRRRSADYSGVAGEPEATTKEASEDFRDSGPTPAPLPEDVGDGRQVWPVGDVWCISEAGAWLPGVYASRAAAILAFDAPDDGLVRLRDRVPGAITEAMLRALLPAGEPAPTLTPAPEGVEPAAADLAGAPDPWLAPLTGIEVRNPVGSPASDEAVARAFHEAYERLAPSHGYETRKASAVPWEQVPANNRALMIAVCAEVAPLIAAQALRSEAKTLRTQIGTQWGIGDAVIHLLRRADELEQGGDQ